MPAPQPSAAQKAEALDSSMRAKDAQWWSNALAAMFGLPSAFMPVSPLPVVATGFTLFGLGFARIVDRMERLADDPPDPSFDSRVRVAQPAVNLQPFAAQEDPFAEAVRPAIAALFSIDALAGAMLRGLERAQGARLAGANPARQAREAETTELVPQVARAMGDFVASVPAVRTALEDLPATPNRLTRGGRLADLLGEHTLALLLLTGVRVTQLQSPVGEAYPNQDLKANWARDLEAFTAAMERYNRLLTTQRSLAFDGL